MLKDYRFQKGQVLIREGDQGDTAWIIRQGRVAVSKQIGDKQLLLSTLGKGEVVGEMALVDEKPRSATVTALEDGFAQMIPREHFLEILQKDSQLSLELLKVLFDRLREAHETMLRLRLQSEKDHPPEMPSVHDAGKPRELSYLMITGLTPQAQASLPEGGFKVRRLPFDIGRATRDPAIHNDLVIVDREPYQVSRSHLVIFLDMGKPAIMDRGSHRGGLLNGVAFGGRYGEQGVQYLRDTDNELCVGSEDSPFRYHIDCEFADGST